MYSRMSRGSRSLRESHCRQEDSQDAYKNSVYIRPLAPTCLPPTDKTIAPPNPSWTMTALAFEAKISWPCTSRMQAAILATLCFGLFRASALEHAVSEQGYWESGLPFQNFQPGDEVPYSKHFFLKVTSPSFCTFSLRIRPWSLFIVSH